MNVENDVKSSAKKKSLKTKKAGSSSNASAPNRVVSSPYFEDVKFWASRILAEFKHKLYDPWDSNRTSWLILCGFQEDEIRENDDNFFMHKLDEHIKSAENRNRDGILFTNIKYLSEILKLNESEREIFTFLAIASRNLFLRKALKEISLENKELIIQLLSCALEVEETAVRAASTSQSMLVETGFFFRREGWRSNEVELWLTLEDAITNVIYSEHEDINSFASSFFKLADAGSLRIADYPHLAVEIRVISGYIQNAITEKLKGVNILIYGLPGTGKTELAKLIASHVGIPMYEVSSDNEEFYSSSARISSYKMCQSFLSKSHNGLVLFDEMEDIFPSENTLLGSKRQKYSSSKAKTNLMLESNIVPTIWLSNDVSYLDPAYLRRFDFTVEMKIPPRSARKAIINRYLSDFDLPPTYMEQLADIVELSPAQIERAAKVVRHCGLNSIDESLKILDLVIQNSMNLMGHSTSGRSAKSIVEFELNFLNVNADIEGITQGFKRHPSGRICLYGPPGTGKSSYGVYLSKALDKPLIVKRASDIFDMYVGETEKNIAKIFRAASQDGAVLMIDEADSLLQDRKDAHRSWEISQVNELLTQMENYEGIFICSTNLMRNIDTASLRRFDFKIYFDYLNSSQRWRLFVKQLQGYGVDLSNIAREKFILDRLHTLTPGDFAVACRQFAVLDKKPTSMEFSAILEQECKAKPGVSKSIGFI